jgi:hypothetical protein
VSASAGYSLSVLLLLPLLLLLLPAMHAAALACPMQQSCCMATAVNLNPYAHMLFSAACSSGGTTTACF